MSRGIQTDSKNILSRCYISDVLVILRRSNSRRTSAKSSNISDRLDGEKRGSEVE